MEDVVPYCGGCGHLYFNEPKVSLEKAKEIAKTRRCHYCVEDAVEEKKNKYKPYQEPERRYDMDDYYY